MLVYAHREDREWHEAAFARVAELVEGKSSWAIPWPCIHEFLSVITHPKVYDPPTPPDEALAQVDAWCESSALVLLSESNGYWRHLGAMARAGRIAGPRIHHARIAALCLDHGIRELWSADRDFNRFTRIRTRNPLVPEEPAR